MTHRSGERESHETPNPAVERAPPGVAPRASANDALVSFPPGSGNQAVARWIGERRGGLTSGERRLGRLADRPDELDAAGNDKFAAQTQSVTGDPVAIVSGPRSPSFVKQFSVFVPSGAAADPDANRVHLFFTPYLAPDGYVHEQGLRAESEKSPWILIGIPALIENEDRPNFVTINTAEIQKCLAAVKRKNPSVITAIRLTAHSRGHRGLEQTIGGTAGGAATIDLGLVERVSVFDASYKDLGDSLKSHEKALKHMQDAKDPTKFAADAVRLYDVTVANISTLPGIKGLSARSIQGLAYMRFAQDGVARGDISPTDLAPPARPPGAPPGPLDSVLTAATRLRGLPFPARGTFSTRDPLPSGMTHVATFLKTNTADLDLLSRPTHGLKEFLTSKGLDAGQPWGNDAHHWLATELTHEAVE
jgi:hypothetical protein